MKSFMDDDWYLCVNPDPKMRTCDDPEKRRRIEIRDLPYLPGSFTVAFPDKPTGYGCFCLHTNPLLITVFFFEPRADERTQRYIGTYVYVGQVTYDDNASTPRETIIQGKRRAFAADGSIEQGNADDDWTSNRPVAGAGPA